MPVNFEKGQAIVIAVFDPKAMNGKPGPAPAPGTPGFKLPLANIIILTTGGKQYSIKPDPIMTGVDPTASGADPKPETAAPPVEAPPAKVPSTPEPPK